MDLEKEITKLTKDFLRESLQIATTNIISYAGAVGKTAALYYHYKKNNNIPKAKSTLMHLKSQCMSLSTITAIQEAKKVEKLLWLSLNTILKIAVETLI